MTGRRRHRSSGPSSHSSSATPHRPHGSGGSGGVGVSVDAIDTMAGRLRATRGRVSGVASTVNGVNVGPQSMGIVGSGFTGAARSHVRHAQEQVARAGQAVEQAEAGTRGTAEAYRGNEATSAAALATIDTSSRPPTTSTPPAAPSTPAPPPPPGGGGPPRNNLGNTADSGELTPQFPRHALDTATTSTEQQIRDIAAAKGYDPDAHIPKTQTPTATLSHDDRVEVADVRNGFQVAPGEVMTKVVKPELADAMLRNQTTFTDPDTGSTRDLRADELGGSVARGSDTAQYDRPVQFREKLGLDDAGAGWSPIKAGATEAYQLRFAASDDVSRFDPSFGSTNPVDAADMQAISGSTKLRPWDPPFLGTGYTDGGATGSGLPEWELATGKHDDRIEMWELRPDGTEVLVGVNLPGRGWFDLR